MPATVKATLKSEPRADKTHAVRIRVTKDREPRYHNTGIYIAKAHWNPKGAYEKENWIKSSHHEAALFNRTIRNQIDEALALSLQHPQMGAEDICKLLKGESPKQEESCFLAFFKKEIERVTKAGNPRTASRRNSIYKKLEKHTGGSLPMSKLTVGFIRDYITHLQTDYKNGAETIKKEMQVLSGVAYLAIDEELLQTNPFKKISVKSRPKKKPRLTPEQLETFKTIPLPEKSPRMLDVRNSFLLQYLMHGARIGDVLELKWRDIDKERINYVMRKNGKIKSIKRNSQINEILKHYEPNKGKSIYVLPFLTNQNFKDPLEVLLKTIEAKTAFINKYLKKIAEAAAIEIPLSTHIARHTFSDVARKKVDMNTLKDMLAHSSIRTTEIYTSELSRDDIDEASDAIYGD
jgi:integrase/recombinase XerD